MLDILKRPLFMQMPSMNASQTLETPIRLFC